MTTTHSRPGAIVIGTGFGTRVHVPALRAAGFDVVALVGRDPERTERRAERAGIEQSFTTVDDALATTSVEFDVVTIATPPATHEPIAVAALQSGRHVVCEKPFACNTGEATRMVDAARASGAIALVGHEFRWATERAVVARAIAAGAIGEPRIPRRALPTGGSTPNRAAGGAVRPAPMSSTRSASGSASSSR